MKKMILAAMMFAAATCAAPAAPQSTIPADTETIVVNKAIDLLNALNMLGGHDEIVGQGASQRVANVPYNFSADTVWAIADDITALRKVVVSYQEAVKAVTAQAEAKNGGPLKPLREAVVNDAGVVVRAEEQSPAQKALAAEIQKMFDSERPVDKLFRIRRGDLKLGENKIPPALISSLTPILDP